MATSDLSRSSPIARLTDDLDRVIDKLMTEGRPPVTLDHGEPHVEPFIEWGEVRGQAQGLAVALSYITCFSVEEIKEQAMVRWEDRSTTKPKRKRRAT